MLRVLAQPEKTQEESRLRLRRILVLGPPAVAMNFGSQVTSMEPRTPKANIVSGGREFGSEALPPHMCCVAGEALALENNILTAHALNPQYLIFSMKF